MPMPIGKLKDWGPFAEQFPNLTQAIQAFRLDLAIGYRDGTTIQGVDYHMWLFAHYAKDNSFPDLPDLTIDHLRAYLFYLQNRPVAFGKRRSDKERISKGYFETIYSKLLRFFTWADKHLLVARNPMSGIPRPLPDAKLVELVSDENFSALLETVNPERFKTRDAHFRAIRNTSMVWLLRDTPARAHELTGLTVRRVDLEGSRLHVTGKGARDRLMPMGWTALSTLKRYMEVRRALNPETSDLWVEPDGKPMGPKWLYTVIKRRGEEIGYPDLHPHQFRHTFVIDMIRAGVPTSVIEYLGGWVRIPRTYLRMIGDRIAGEFQDHFSPGDRAAHRIGNYGLTPDLLDNWGKRWVPGSDSQNPFHILVPETPAVIQPVSEAGTYLVHLLAQVDSLLGLEAGGDAPFPPEVNNVLMKALFVFLKEQGSPPPDHLAGRLLPAPISALNPGLATLEMEHSRGGRFRKRQS